MLQFDYSGNFFSLEGAKTALEHFFVKNGAPKSVLDVGCGIGTWVRAALDYGVTDVCGIDGVAMGDNELLFPREFFRQQDLTSSWNLGRTYDLALCLEVAEHLPTAAAGSLVRNLAKHSDTVLFSAACPGQIGQHHVNCQWPEYWQQLFNTEGYTCEDAFRWQIWTVVAVEPWYRQNSFVAKRNVKDAGSEPRIKAVIHPEMLASRAFDIFQAQIDLIESGHRRLGWYLSIPFRACIGKLKRKTESRGRTIKGERPTSGRG
jgi:hypothetical protein